MMNVFCEIDHKSSPPPLLHRLTSILGQWVSIKPQAKLPKPLINTQHKCWRQLESMLSDALSVKVVVVILQPPDCLKEVDTNGRLVLRNRLSELKAYYRPWQILFIRVALCEPCNKQSHALGARPIYKCFYMPVYSVARLYKFKKQTIYIGHWPWRMSARHTGMMKQTIKW